MSAAASTSAQLQLAVFIDFENLALGLRDGDPPFDVRRILDRLLEKGKVIAKVAYADWNRFRTYTTSLHENGIELIEIPRRSTTGKNSADIRLVVDAMDLAWSKSHIDTFVIVSGDSDFSPLVAKLKENGKHVIGLGMKASTSPLLANGCDEFIYYEDLEQRHARDRGAAKPSGDRDDAFRLLTDTVLALQRENFEVIQASLVKDTIKRKRPAFSEAALGYGSFSDLLEDAQQAGVIALRKDDRSGTYLVSAVARPASRTRGGSREGSRQRSAESGANGTDRARTPEPARSRSDSSAQGEPPVTVDPPRIAAEKPHGRARGRRRTRSG